MVAAFDKTIKSKKPPAHVLHKSSYSILVHWAKKAQQLEKMKDNLSNFLVLSQY